MKAYGVSGCIDPHFLELSTSWRWVGSFTPLPPYPRGKSPLYPLDRRFGGPQSRSGRRGEEKILDSTGTRTLNPRSSSPITTCYTDHAIPAHEIRPDTNYKFSSIQPHYGPGVDSASNRNEYQESSRGLRAASAWGLQPYRHLWADCLENVGASAARYRNSFTYLEKLEFRTSLKERFTVGRV
jgi:hypothetical protein